MPVWRLLRASNTPIAFISKTRATCRGPTPLARGGHTKTYPQAQKYSPLPTQESYFQNKSHLSQADTARAWRPYDDLPPGWEGVVAPNANVKGDWG